MSLTLFDLYSDILQKAAATCLDQDELKKMVYTFSCTSRECNDAARSLYPEYLITRARMFFAKTVIFPVMTAIPPHQSAFQIRPGGAIVSRQRQVVSHGMTIPVDVVHGIAVMANRVPNPFSIRVSPNMTITPFGVHICHGNTSMRVATLNGMFPTRGADDGKDSFALTRRDVPVAMQRSTLLEGCRIYEYSKEAMLKAVIDRKTGEVRKAKVRHFINHGAKAVHDMSYDDIYSKTVSTAKCMFMTPSFIAMMGGNCRPLIMLRRDDGAAAPLPVPSWFADATSISEMYAGAAMVTRRNGAPLIISSDASMAMPELHAISVNDVVVEKGHPVATWNVGDRTLVAFGRMNSKKARAFTAVYELEDRCADDMIELSSSSDDDDE